MDLSLARFDRGAIVTALPNGMAVLLAAAAGRQAGSVTARLQARLTQQKAANTVFARCDGAFNIATAAALACWMSE